MSSTPRITSLFFLALLPLTLSGIGCGESSDMTDADVGIDASDTDHLSGDSDLQGDADEDSDEDINEVFDPFDELPPKPWSSQAAGPFRVGYRYDSFEYTPRGDSEEVRPIKVSIWYPTFEERGRTAAYIDLIRQPGIWAEPEPALREPAPLMLFSHGNSSLSTQSYFWTEFLASHGWIVVAPDHLFNTFSDTPGAINYESGAHRPQDISATLDFILDLPDEDPLAGMVSDHIALSGHSFGGYTTLATAGASFPVDEILTGCSDGTIQSGFCAMFSEKHVDLFRQGFHDERIRVAIPHTPGGFDAFQDGLAEIEIPVFLWTAERDATLPNSKEGDPIWENLVGPHHVRADVLNTGHFTFSNMCDFLSTLPLGRDDGCGDDFFQSSEVYPLINAYSLEFLRLHLFGDEAAKAWFSPDHEALHPNVNFSFKTAQ